jgi:DNA-binding MarR family transcriptional regulator
MSAHLANRLAAAGQLVNDLVDERLADHVGTAGSRPSALTALAHDPRQSIETLRASLGLTHSGAVRMVDTLAAEGLLRREKQGRVVLLALTELGERQAALLEQTRMEAAAAALAKVPPQLQQALEQALDHLLAGHTGGRADRRRICRRCSYGACEGGGERCPVAAAATGLAPGEI